MRVLRLTVAYDGTDLAGWQRQTTGRTAQALLEEALSQIDGAAVTVVGAGRTDAGVHAAGQVASAVVANDLDPLTLRRALNANLPPDVRVLSVEQAADGFDARRDARRKTYEYTILNGPVARPFTRRFAWHIPQRLDDSAMKRAAARLLGSHDFASFQSTGSSVVTTRRTIFESVVFVGADLPPSREASADRHLVRRSPQGEGGSLGGGGQVGLSADVLVDPPAIVRYRITGDGFLRHMVRAIVGTLVEIGLGRREAESMDAIIGARDRAAAGPTAPAHGLCLVRVEY